MEGGSIQLPFGYVRDENESDKLQFNFLFNFRKDILFDKLPYVALLKNPAIDNVVKGGRVDDVALQKYLLATDLLQDTIQENLNMIVTDCDFNNMSVRRELDTKYPSVMKKSNQIDVVFKDKAKFDVQNPVVGSLIVQVQENKKKEREYLKQLSGAPSVTDIDIGKRLKELKDFNEGRDGGDSHDDYDEPGEPPTSQPSSSRTSGDIFPTSPYTLAVDGNDNLTPVQHFFLIDQALEARE